MLSITPNGYCFFELKIAHKDNNDNNKLFNKVLLRMAEISIVTTGKP